MPLEGLWFADDLETLENFAGKRNAWKWTAMILQPEFITKKMIDEAIEEVKNKKKLPGLSKIRFENFH